jgi:hypothetical protein
MPMDFANGLKTNDRGAQLASIASRIETAKLLTRWSNSISRLLWLQPNTDIGSRSQTLT